MKYTCINIQGNLISEEILKKIEQGEAQGQLATDFGLEPGSNIRSEIEYAWSRIKLDWKHFNDKIQNLPVGDPYGTTSSRKWMEQFLSSIGFDLSRPKSGLLGDNNNSYTISHTAENLDYLPIHIVGFFEPIHPEKNTLDIKTSGGTSKFSPHGTMQEYLNVTENIYGIASNGLFLRLIRDSGRLIKLTYIEFDLKRMMDEDKYSEFTLLYRLLHASRFPRIKEEAEQCFLETYFKESIETGNRIRDGLSLAVKESLMALGKGFLQHEHNTSLRDKIQAGKLSPKDYYRQLLRIIYRFLFLMVTEERDLVYELEDKSEKTQTLKKYYFLYYSIARLRKLSESHYVYEAQFSDLWQGLTSTFLLFEGQSNGKKLGIYPLNGDLFSDDAITDLQGSLISNMLLLECVKNLNEFKDESKNLVSINYRSLDVEELGSVYEGLLELHPVIENIEASNPAQINFTFHEGTDRKTTGSYYTRPELVNELIKSALIPIIEVRLKEHAGNTAAQAKSLLKLKVCDAAAGSGHMLLAAARTIAWYLARVQSGEENPAPSVYRKCLREVIQHCIYAVDHNPDAVELCKLALWLEGHNSGKPLSFLDHKIRNGNSLVGVADLNVLQKGIPDDAFNAVTSDDKKICQEFKKENAKYNKTKQVSFDFDQSDSLNTTAFTGDYKELENLQQDDLDGVEKVKAKFEKFRNNHTWFKDWRACNLWTAAFFWNYTEDNKLVTPNSERLAKFLTNPAAALGSMIGKADALSMEHNFFHWPLEFPDVFEQGGFDVMLGNPPWEIVELSEKEFFLTRDNEITKSDTATIRKKLIDDLKLSNPQLHSLFIERKHSTDCQRKFLQGSGRFPESSKGRINLYPLFLENNISRLAKIGMCGLIVPSDIAMGAYNADLFSKIIIENRLVSFFDFENTQNLFPAVDSRYRFCLITLSGASSMAKEINLLYQGKTIADLANELKKIKLTNDDLEFFSPNTLAPPILHSNVDLSISRRIYSNIGVLNNHKKKDNKWGVSIKRMLSLSDGEGLFKKSYELSPEELNSDSEWSRLYSGKAIHQYDHRFSTYESRKWVDTTISGHINSENTIETEYYAKKVEVLKRTNQQLPISYLVGYRDVTNSTNERTCIGTIVPRVGCDSHCRNIYFQDVSNILISVFVGNINSLPFDYFVRQKVIGTGLGSGTFEQLPVLPPLTYNTSVFLISVPTIIELIYCSWDIKSFANDIWKEANADLKAAIVRQWEENKEITGGHEWAPPVWCEKDESGCPLPPFKWHENRRAVLKAQLDAVYAKLYDLTTEELRYILDPQDVYGTDFPGETFRVLKDKETRLYGEYRSRRLVLEAWEKLNKSIPSITINIDPAMIDLSLHQGIYSISETATITGFTFQKVTSWFKELSKENYEGINAKQAKDIAAGRISFHGLIELVVIGTLRENGFSLKKILKARSELNIKTKKIYPFATNNVSKSLKISGSDIVWEFGDNVKVTLDGSSQINIDFIHLFFSDIVFKNDVAQSLMPSKGNKKVIIDPKIGLGKPVIVTKEVPVDLIASKYRNDIKAIELLKREYELDDEEIMAAVAYMQ